MAKYTNDQLRAIFRRPFDQEAWKAIVKDIFRATSLRIKPELFTLPDEAEKGYYFGTIDTPDNFHIGVFFYKIDHGSVAHKKVGLRNLVKKFVNPKWGEFDAALVVFSDGNNWRLSFVCDIKEEATTPKRFTYVFGEHDNFYRTAIERFSLLQSTDATFENIRKAFSVDALSDDFFNRYRDLYADFVQYITGKRYVKENGKWVERALGEPNHQYASIFEKDDKLVRDYIKKMFGRIVFLYFLQRKGWLAGNRNYMHSLFADSQHKDDFLNAVLEPLFFEVLNTDLPDRTEAALSLPGCSDIPYLNGGLFARDEIDERSCVFPEDYFRELFDFLDSYNFTIDENDSDDAEIGIDPEMLGRIFENLLEDNKDKGAFYTPKEIVSYMCREAIIAYLLNGEPEDTHAAIRNFVEKLDASELDDAKKLDLRRKLQAVKICDPAIGSGAFPMGLVNLLSKLYVAMKADTDTAKMKRHIMEQNIYGVDIEKGAVDIARLRFWLAMIVEEEKPMPLPNLHFKIMQGNSLLESYNGTDLSDLTKVSQQTSLFDSDNAERKALLDDLREYYKTSDHAKRDRLFNQIINNVRRQLASKDIVLPQDIDPSANEDFFLWHTWFADVFDNGGFDIVIGNPPYIQLQANGGYLSKLYQNEGFETFIKTGDIYQLFYEHGINLLKNNAQLCYITSNKWMKTAYGKLTRLYFEENTYPIILIDFNNNRVFENAQVDVNIILIKKSKYSSLTKCVEIEKDFKKNLYDLSEYIESKYIYIDFTQSKGESWIISNPIANQIRDKIKHFGIPLSQWNIEVNMGIKTGLNKAFIISSDQRESILQACSNDEEYERTKNIIRPILRGRDVSSFNYKWDGQWIIFSHNGIKGRLPRIDVEQFPSIKSFLDKFIKELSERQDKGDTPYNLRSCKYINEFDKPKLIYREISESMNACLLPPEMIINNKSFMITGDNIEYLVAFFNSSLFKKIILPKVSFGGGKGPEFINNIYSVLPQDGDNKIIVELISRKEFDKLDEYIMDMFHLTDEEKSFIMKE